MHLESINPATGAHLKNYPALAPIEIHQRLDQAQRAFDAWKHTPFATRAVHFRNLAATLRRHTDYGARLMALEMGKPLVQGRAEMEKCAWACDFFAEHAESFLAPSPVATEARSSYVACQPLGLILAVMPWNFPFWQVFRCAAPALMAGNVMVLKHASNVPGCALAIEAMFHEAGLPDHVFQTLLLPSSHIGTVLAHPSLRGVALTGSTEAGQHLAQAAGQRLLKTVLELGGSDPYLVLEDADLESAARLCATARLINSGQSCIAAKRFIVHHTVQARFEALFVQAFRDQVMGDPLDERTTVGPLARRDLRATLHEQVQESLRLGAHCLLGGSVPLDPGAFYPPTILTGVTPGMPVFDQETFGPVAALTTALDDAEAVRLANRTPFGLGAAVFTSDPARGERIALELEAGCCAVNDAVRSDPRLPFGGIKASGYGRELGLAGIREFVNLKTVVIR
jgi:succinate-semialdehyde dehydrogenase/glutarate-semialdehyde dehydrogenase